MKFQVNVKVTALVSVPIEADSEEEAKEKASKLAVVAIDDGAGTPFPPHQCWVQLNFPDNEILVLDAVESRALDQLNEQD